MTQHWIGVASKEHVKGAVIGGFAQVCHGKSGPLNRMEAGDWIVYYSPTILFGGKEACQSFTAIGKIKEGTPYQYVVSKDFVPWRRNVDFIHAQDIRIHELIDDLSFIKDKQKWGYPFRMGCFKISQEDFFVIAKAMGIFDEEKCKFQRDQCPRYP